MRLFTPARDRALCRDALLIDTLRLARPLLLEPLTPLEPVIETLLDRVALMGRSLLPVRSHAFALFLGAREGRTVFAITEPFHVGLVAVLVDSLAAFGAARAGEAEPLAAQGLTPLFGFEGGRVLFFDSLATRPFHVIARRRALRILGATLSHAPDPDVEVEGVPAPEYVARCA
ncbi:MAG: hypothetical protein ACT4PV_02660 [Planctomycetaceae bacterium]